MRLHVIMAAHNRVEMTARSVEHVLSSAETAGTPCRITLLDDGSTDGTSDAVSRMDSVTVVRGAGDFYWARSMATAEARALGSDAEFDWLVWLNDDVQLDSDWLDRTIPIMRGSRSSVLVGAMRDPTSQQITYGGYRRRGLHPLRLRRVTPDGSLQAIDTFNGNLVFVPREVALLLGGIDGGFSHALADLDYGLRCVHNRVRVFLLPEALGSCPRHDAPASGSMSTRWRNFTGVKGGGNFRSMLRFAQRHAPRTWPLHVSSTYGLWIFRSFLDVSRMRKRRKE